MVVCNLGAKLVIPAWQNTEKALQTLNAQTCYDGDDTGLSKKLIIASFISQSALTEGAEMRLSSAFNVAAISTEFTVIVRRRHLVIASGHGLPLYYKLLLFPSHFF